MRSVVHFPDATNHITWVPAVHSSRQATTRCRWGGEAIIGAANLGGEGGDRKGEVHEREMVHAGSYPPFLLPPHLPPFCPWTCTTKMPGACPRQPIVDREVFKGFISPFPATGSQSTLPARFSAPRIWLQVGNGKDGTRLLVSGLLELIIAILLLRPVQTNCPACD